MEHACFLITVSRPTGQQPNFVVRATVGVSDLLADQPHPLKVALDHGLALQDMEIANEVRAGSAFSTEVQGLQYAGSMTIDRQRAETMARTLKVIEDGLGRLEDDLGVPLSFGQYLARLAKVLGIRKFLFTTTQGGTSTVDTREAISRVDLLVGELVREQRGGTTHHETI